MFLLFVVQPTKTTSVSVERSKIVVLSLSLIATARETTVLTITNKQIVRKPTWTSARLSMLVLIVVTVLVTFPPMVSQILVTS